MYRYLIFHNYSKIGDDAHMSNWEDYKKTMRDSRYFDSARAGLIEDFAGVSFGDINVRDAKGHSYLMLAAYNGHLELCALLLDKGADPNSTDHSGNSILMGVAFKGHAEIAGLLIDRGADLWRRNPKGQTALDFAKMFGRADTVRKIKEKNNETGEFSILDVVQGWSSYLKGARQ